MMNSICRIVLLPCFPQVWACWWHGCLTPTTWTSWWWASLTACPLKALWRSWVDQTWIKPLWLHRRANARAAKREWLSTFAPNWLDLGTVSLKAIKAMTVRATFCVLKLELTWFFTFIFFFSLLGVWREQGYKPAPGARPKGKVCFVMVEIKRL